MYKFAYLWDHGLSVIILLWNDALESMAFQIPEIEFLFEVKHVVRAGCLWKNFYERNILLCGLSLKKGWLMR